MDCLDLRKRYDTAKLNRSSIEGIWDLIEKYVVPFRGEFYVDPLSENEVEWRKRQIFDSTAVTACQTLASTIDSGMSNPATKWFDLSFRNKAIRHDQEARAWIEECTNLVYFALLESNFHLEASECYLDLTSYGTSVIVEEVEEEAGALKNLDFSAIPVSECCFEQDHKGRVAYFYRNLSWTPVQIVSKFGRENVPEDIRLAAKDAVKSAEKWTVIFAIYPRAEAKDANTDTILAPTKRPYGFKFFLRKDATQLGDEGGYYEMPTFIPRWRKTVGSMWGHSPAMVCLSDVMTLNMLVELILLAAEKAIDPPILTTKRGIFGDVNLVSGGETVVADIKDNIAAFESKGRFDVGALTKGDLQRSIKETFFIDQLQLKESPAMTATEVIARRNITRSLMGPTANLIQFDFHDPLITRTFKILLRYRMLPPVPAIVADSKTELDISYMGPIARSQKMDEVNSINQWVGGVASMAEIKPEILDNINFDNVAKYTSSLGGVPADILNSKTEIAKIRKDREAEQKRMQDLEQMKMEGDGAEAVGKGVEAIKGATGGQAGPTG